MIYFDGTNYFCEDNLRRQAMSTDADETVADLHRLFTGLSRLASRMRLRNAIHPGIRNLAWVSPRCALSK